MSRLLKLLVVFGVGDQRGGGVVVVVGPSFPDNATGASEYQLLFAA